VPTTQRQNVFLIQTCKSTITWILRLFILKTSKTTGVSPYLEYEDNRGKVHLTSVVETQLGRPITQVVQNQVL